MSTSAGEPFPYMPPAAPLVDQEKYFNSQDNPFGVTFSQNLQTFSGKLADGIYPGTVRKIERVTSTFDNRTVEQFAFLFTVDGRENEGELVWYTGVKMSLHAKAKLPPTLDVLGLARPTPKSPQLPNPVGTRAKLFIKNEPSRRDPSAVFPKIKELLPA